MNKDELLKIYSAYLPYGLNFRFCHGWSETIMELHSVSYEKGVVNDNVYLEPKNIEPILYDLSYLTKEIEHEGVKKILAKELFAGKWKEISDYYVNTNQILKLSYDSIQALLKHHFNVFNLPEDQFINKATLTNK